MNTSPASRNLAPATQVDGADLRADDDEIPLGWESAYPALQIERWVAEERKPGSDAC